MLDLRDTFIGDSEIACFTSTSELTEIYLECPNLDSVQFPNDQPPIQEELHIRIGLGEHQVQQRPAEVSYSLSLSDSFLV